MIVCPQCGFENGLGRIFCSKCGTKLNLTDVSNKQVDDTAKPKSHVGSKGALFILVLLIVTGGLACWPLIPQVSVGGGVELKTAQAKIQLIEKVAARKAGGGAQGSIAVPPQVFSEDEVNAYLDAVFEKKIKPGFSDGLSRVDYMVIDLKTGKIMLAIASRVGPFRVSSFQLKAVPVTYAIIGIPCNRGQGFEFDVKGGMIGHLPLPGPLGNLLVSPASKLFASLDKWKAMLGGIESYQIEPDSITVSFGNGGVAPVSAQPQPQAQAVNAGGQAPTSSGQSFISRPINTTKKTLQKVKESREP